MNPLDLLEAPLRAVLDFFHGIGFTWGWAIVMLTLVVRLILLPLFVKQYKSARRMQEVAPQMKELQRKYKGNKQKLQEEMMKFYKENEINPFGGCLPLVLQMPIFIGLYRLLNNIPTHIPKTGPFSALYTSICDAPGAQCIAKAGEKAIYKLPFFPNGMFDLHLSAGKGHDSFIAALPYWILVALVVVSAYAQQKQTMRFQTQANAQMQMVGRIMPIFFAFISINIPAGVVLYFFVSNLWQIGQQEIIYRRIGTPTGEPVGKKAKARHIEATSREVGQQAGIEPAPEDGGGKSPSADGTKQAPGGAKPDPNRARRKRKKK